MSIYDIEMPIVIIESPFAGTGETEAERKHSEWRNIAYLRAAMHDCIVNRKEAPYASHALYTQAGVLDDMIEEERTLGIAAGFNFRRIADKTVVYTDLGISRGMEYGIADAEAKNTPVEFRTIPGWS